jgi:hypothetical protein
MTLGFKIEMEFYCLNYLLFKMELGQLQEEVKDQSL